MPAQPVKPEAENPVGHFSQCHVGIVSHLQELGRLPELLGPAAEARRIAEETLRFFRAAVYEHHSEEERELFPAVLSSAVKGEERNRVQSIVDRLTAEHRRIEARWTEIEPGLKLVAKGHDSPLDASEVAALVADYQAHARYEEEAFLPLSETILGRNDNHMAALGVSLHLRHSVPAVLQRYGSRI